VIDEQRAAGELGEASIRHNMNLLSRFFSWAIARGKASINPVRQIPMGSRPTQKVKSDTPWLDDDAIVLSCMFYLCNRSGLRTGEAAGLRMSDMAFVDEGLRHLSRGASLDEVSAAVGHSSPIVTKRFYDLCVRRSFSPKLRAGLGLTSQQAGGRIVSMKRSAR
jgi:site-specific recombinase XerC